MSVWLTSIHRQPNVWTTDLHLHAAVALPRVRVPEPGRS
jgi:hypothetical protein